MRISVVIVSSLTIPLVTGGFVTRSSSPAGGRQAPAATQPVDRQPTLDEYEALVDLVANAPAWPESDTMTTEQWRTLARTASALQSLGDANMALLLVKYMKKHGENLPDQIDDPDPRTKPLLLLAAMFDLSKPKTDDLQALYVDRQKRGVRICGGFFYHQVSRKNLPLLEQFAMPLSWTADGPKLTATRVARVAAQHGGPHHGGYEPWVEFHHFARFYEHRSSFPPYVNADGPTWRQLISEGKPRESRDSH